MRPTMPWQVVKPGVTALTVLMLLGGSWLLYASPHDSLPQLLPPATAPGRPPAEGPSTLAPAGAGPVAGAPLDASFGPDLVAYFEDYPLTPPHKENFGELGRRARLLHAFLARADHLGNDTAAASERQALTATADRLAVALFAFLRAPPRNPSSRSPLSDLRASFTPHSAGIVVPAGNHNVRFAAQLICCLRNVLASTLPIQIVYAGDDDLSPASRRFLRDLPRRAAARDLPALEFLDIRTVFDDAPLALATGGWAIKPFAALGARFERVLLVDADAVFLQPPEALLRHAGFARTGALLFRDRLLWQHAFADRHAWWHAQIRRPSAALASSLAWTREFAEEGDSGVVVLDKRRADVLAALLHVGWQNSRAVRDDATYRLTYGDKESWWMGLEMAGARYEMEPHYAAIVGWERPVARAGPAQAKVCSFVIAHLDAAGALLWYNGGLPKNKQLPALAREYEVPDKWMVDAEWQKGASKPDMSCMVGRRDQMHDLSAAEKRILERSIREATWVDAALPMA